MGSLINVMTFLLLFSETTWIGHDLFDLLVFLSHALVDELKAQGSNDKAQTLLDEMDSLLAKSDFAGLKKLIEQKKTMYNWS